MKDQLCRDNLTPSELYPSHTNLILKPEPRVELNTQLHIPFFKSSQLDPSNLELGTFKETPISQIQNQLEKQFEIDRNWILTGIEEKELYSQEIINEVYQISEQILNDFYGCYLQIPSIPKFLPGPKGTIEVYWKTKSWEFIFNYNPQNKSNIEYYGKDNDGNETRGVVNNPKRLTELLGWSQNLK